MSSREFAGWMAYASMVPMPAERADLRAATVAALFAEANRDRKRRRKPYEVGEFCALFSGESLRDGEGGIATSPKGGAPRNDKAWELWANVRAWAVGCGAKPKGAVH